MRMIKLGIQLLGAESVEVIEFEEDVLTRSICHEVCSSICELGGHALVFVPLCPACVHYLPTGRLSLLAFCLLTPDNGTHYKSRTCPSF
jgi:hypothetical protein